MKFQHHDQTRRFAEARRNQRAPRAWRYADNVGKASPDPFRELADSIDGIVWEADPGTFDFTFVNKRAETMLGYPIERWINEPNFWLNHLHPDDREPAAESCRRFTEKAEHHQLIYRMMRADGSYIWLKDVVTVVSSGGCAIKLRGVMIDITEQKMLEHKLQRVQEMLQLVMDNIPQSIFWKDVNSVIMGCNKQFAKEFGFSSPEELVGKTDYDLSLSQDDIAFYRQYDRHVINSGQPQYQIIEPIHGLDGTERWIETNKVPMHDETGKIIGVLGTFQNVTERLTHQKALQRAHDELEKRVRERTQELAQANESLRAEISRHRRSKLKIEQLNARLQSKLAQLAGANEELLNLQLKLESARDAAIQLAEAKSMFAADISHELRTPLAGIISLSELLMQSDLQEEQSEIAHTIDVSARYLARTINSILDFSKLEAGKAELDKKPLVIADIFKEVLELVYMQARARDLTLETGIDSRIPEVLEGDQTRIEQVLLNLASNAIKFTQRGSVRIMADLLYIDDQEARVKFSVSDTGIGIPKAKLESIFEPFLQVDKTIERRHGGTGLGLAICQRLVALMNGSIHVESELNGGSTFWFELPMQRVKGTARVVPSAVTPPHFEPGHKVLLVEDDPVLQKVGKVLLTRLGLEVDVASNGTQAVQQARGNGYDLILMDYQLPEMNGLEATQAIRENEKGTKKHVPIIAMTASAMPEDRDRCLASGMDDYLSKPVDSAHLWSLIDRWMPDAA